MDNDRRQYPRFKKNLTVKIHLPYTEMRVKTENISLGGACLCNVERYYYIKQAVYIEILLRDGDSIFCHAGVLSIYPNTKGAVAYKLNVQFTDMSGKDKERLKNYIED